MPQLRASAAQVELPARIGDRMCGFAARIKPAEGRHDPLCTRAVLLESGGDVLLIISCDNLHFGSAESWELRCRIEARTAIPAEGILLCSTHTHSSTTSRPEWLARIIDMAARLPDALSPARIAHGSVRVPGIGFNRDDQARPVDDELITIAVETMDGAPIATLINYATHAVTMGPSNLLLSGDYPGYVSRRIETRGGVGVFLQGACGDIDPVVYLESGWGRGTFEDCESIADRLVDAAEDALGSAPRESDMSLRVGSDVVTVPLDPPPSHADLDRMIAEWEMSRPVDQDAGTDWREQETFLRWAGRIRDAVARDAVPSSFNAHITAAAIGDLRIFAVPFEPYCDIGLRVKAQLGPGSTAFVGYANGVHGYLASRWAKERGGYGADTSVRYSPTRLTGFGVGADEALIEAAVALGRRLRSE